MARILYFGDGSAGSTSGHRLNALRRIGHEVDLQDPIVPLAIDLQSWRGAINFRTGYTFIQAKVKRWLQGVFECSLKPDLIWIDLGEFFGPECYKILKTWSVPIVVYNVDDPTGRRDGARFKQFLRTITYPDLVVVVRNESVIECKALGAKRVEHVYRSYDEEMHKPFSSIDEIPPALKSEVAFIGTWMRREMRDEFMLKLVERGVPISIWGDRWQKSPMFSKLEKHWRGGGVFARDYTAAIQGSKICIGMLSKGNRDLHTTRSLEIPYAGGLFCGERTPEHQQLYEENVDAVFWSDAEECASVCIKLLEDDILRDNIRVAGMKKVRSLHLGNEDVARKIINIFLS